MANEFSFSRPIQANMILPNSNSSKSVWAHSNAVSRARVSYEIEPLYITKGPRLQDYNFLSTPAPSFKYG